jgi:hypothetical protein
VLAVLLVPYDYSQPGALIPSSLALATGLLLPIGYISLARPMQLFRADNLLFAGIVYWLLFDLMQGVNEPQQDVSPAAVRLAFVAIGLFAIGIWIALLFRPWRLPAMVTQAATAKPPSESLFGVLVACFVLGMANYLIATNFDIQLIIDTLGKARFEEPWGAKKVGGLESFRTHLVYFGYLVPSLTVLLAVRAGWGNVMTILAIIMSIIVLAFPSQSGVRGEIGVIGGSAILTWLLTRSNIGLGVLFRTGLATVLLLAWMQVMYIYRKEGLSKFFEGPTISRLQEKHVAVDDNFYRLCQVMELFPDHIDFVFGKQIYYVAVRPIPRAIWENKPLGPGFDFEELVRVRGCTLSVSVIGELYFDFGLMFVFLGGLVFGRLAGMWNRLLFCGEPGSAWPLMYAAGTMALFIGIRSEQAFVVRTYPVLAWLAISQAIFWYRSSSKSLVRPAVS